MKNGFTLVEIMVVVAIFGVLMIVATDFFVSTLQNTNRSTMQNEVRQNAQKIMQDIISEIRRADSYTIVDTGPNKGDLISASATGTTTYHVDTTSWNITKNGVQLNSDSVVVLDCNGIGCGSTCVPARNFLLLTPAAGTNLTNALTINLVVQQRTGVSNSTYCAITTLNDTATPRQY